MQSMEDDFQAIYGSITGRLAKEYRVPWVKCAWEENTGFEQAYDDFWTARENLCKRFGMDWEDEDLERFMNGILHLEEDLSRKLFFCTLEYAQRGFSIE